MTTSEVRLTKINNLLLRTGIEKNKHLDRMKILCQREKRFEDLRSQTRNSAAYEASLKRKVG